MLSWTLASAVLLLYAAALYALLGRPQATDDSFAARAVAAACLAPSGAAWVLGLCWRVAPGLSVSATLAVLVFIPAIPVLMTTIRRWPGVASALRSFKASWAPLQVLPFLLLLASIVYLVMRIPPYSNDPLEYAAVAQLLHDTRSLHVYPVLDTSASGGLYAPWTHPPGFPLLIALFMLFGAVEAGTALKLVAVLHVVLGIAGLALLLPRRVRWIAALSLIATPAYLLGVFNGYVEVVRLTALIGALGACLALYQAPAVASAMRLGLLFGLCGFVHSLGIVSVAFFLPALLLLRHGAPVARIAWAAGIVASQLLLLAPDLWLNLSNFGVLLGDRPAVWQIQEIGRAEYFREFRSLSTPADIVVSGLLQGFSQLSHFGISYWLPAGLALWAVLYRRTMVSAGSRGLRAIADVVAKWPPAVVLSVGVVVTFYLMAVSLVVLGSVEAIKNARYVLTLQPFVAIATGWLVLELPRADFARRVLVGGLLVCSLIPVGYMHERYPGLLTGRQTPREAYFAYVHPEADAVLAVGRLTAGKGCPLLFKQADYAVYGQHCYWSYLDHRFTDVYRAGSATEAAQRLRAHDIAVIMTPNYAMPEIYNTAVGALLADPRAARLRWAQDGYSVFDLLTPPIDPRAVVKSGEVIPPQAASPATVDWADLAIHRPGAPEGELVGVLCVDAVGRGRVEVATIDPEASPPAGVLLRAVRAQGRFVMAAATAGRRRICAQQLPSHARGRLQVQTSASVRVERIAFTWTQLAAAVGKEH
jgi:hypothetical protein